MKGATQVPIDIYKEISQRVIQAVRWNDATKKFEPKGYKSPEEALKAEFKGQGGWTLRRRVEGFWLANYHNGKIEVVNTVNESFKISYPTLLNVCKSEWPEVEGKQLSLF